MAIKDIESSPSLEEWRGLYKSAIEFEEIAPWNWMWDSDLFGVQNPQGGEIGYCCVLGRAGEVFGLAVFLGTEGLKGYLGTQEGNVESEDDDLLYTKKCLLVSFEEKQDLQKADLEVIKELELEFKGKNAWPLFRSYQPGYHPWYLTNGEAKFLKICLQQTKDVSLRFKKNSNLFETPQSQSFFVRVQKKSGAAQGWKDAWRKPAPLKRIVIMAKSIDEQRLQDIIKKSSRQRRVWEADFFYAPAYIAEKGKRPYFPLALLFADSDSYFILNAHITTPNKYRVEIYEQFLKTIEKMKIIPEEIWVRKEEMFFFLKPFIAPLGIKMRLVKKLKAVNDVRKHMSEFFSRRKQS